MEGPLRRCAGHPLADDVALGYVPSPGYSEGDAHGGFNPNTTFSHAAPQHSSPTGFGHDPRTPSLAFSAGLNTQYGYSPLGSEASPASSLRRRVLPFAPTSSLKFNYADAEMGEIIASGSVAAVLYPEFGVQDETMDTSGEMDDELDDAEEEEGKEEVVETEWNPCRRRRGGRESGQQMPSRPNRASSGRPRKTSVLPKRGRLSASTPITGANHNTDT
ncbi:putative methionyl-tRNA synthetase [Hordeum vulgare]|nr:putative methionyl-tRNA synthetase [Hordeum vulgare]